MLSAIRFRSVFALKKVCFKLTESLTVVLFLRSKTLSTLIEATFFLLCTARLDDIPILVLFVVLRDSCQLVKLYIFCLGDSYFVQKMMMI